MADGRRLPAGDRTLVDQRRDAKPRSAAPATVPVPADYNGDGLADVAGVSPVDTANG
jgi:hypothetical protein